MLVIWKFCGYLSVLSPKEHWFSQSLPSKNFSFYKHSRSFQYGCPIQHLSPSSHFCRWKTSQSLFQKTGVLSDHFSSYCLPLPLSFSLSFLPLSLFALHFPLLFPLYLIITIQPGKVIFMITTGYSFYFILEYSQLTMLW